MCIFSCFAAKLWPQRAELSNIHLYPLLLACLQKVLFAQAAPCPKTVEIKSDFSREPRHVCRGFAVGFVFISLHPRNITSFLQNLISGYFPGLGKGEKRAYCALVHQRVPCVKTVGCFSPVGPVKVWAWVFKAHGLCQSVVQNHAAGTAWIHVKPPPNPELGHLCWAAVCPVPGIRGGDFWCKILFSGSQDVLLYNLVRFLYSPLQ